MVRGNATHLPLTHTLLFSAVLIPSFPVFHHPYVAVIHTSKCTFTYYCHYRDLSNHLCSLAAQMLLTFVSFARKAAASRLRMTLEQ